MDDAWYDNLSRDTAVIVPTRSLANALNEQIAAAKLAKGVTVWEAPNILLWQDYLAILWQLNRDKLAPEAQGLLSTQQSFLLWNQVIDVSRRNERALNLLNVQQTARAAQRSYKLMGDWLIKPEIIRDDHVADSDQFLQWLEAYQSLLEQRGFLDTTTFTLRLLERSNDSLEWPFKSLIWYYYDLVTDAQHAFNQAAQLGGVRLTFHQPETSSSGVPGFQLYPHQSNELRAVLVQARTLIEKSGDQRINIVVPDLQNRYAEVKEAAREIFYPGLSPLELSRHNTVYRFSLGQPMNQWPAVEAALRAISLLNNHTNVSDLGYLLRNQFLYSGRTFAQECRLFERWLKRKRYRRLSLDSLPDLYEQCLQSMQKETQATESSGLLDFLLGLRSQRLELADLLQQRQKTAKFATLSFSEWVSVFSSWLDLWGWRTHISVASADSVEYQLQQRWQSLIEEFAALARVQHQLGLRRAIELLQQMTRDAIFLPKAMASPIFISGVYEAIGRPVDYCFVISMDQNYPPPPVPDSFIPNRILARTGMPDAQPENAFKQANKVVQSLLTAANRASISYSQVGNDQAQTHNQPSPLYRKAAFVAVHFDVIPDAREPLKSYTDEQGPAWTGDTKVPGGAQIFENQSQCEFKAFANHQLGFLDQNESEFGLDALDQGIFIHQLLQALWARVEDQNALRDMSEIERHDLLKNVIDTQIRAAKLSLSEDKHVLLQNEEQRFFKLLERWIQVELSRTQNFSVVEREERRDVEIGGIQFSYIIDRLDMTDDGRTVLVDYKTGEVARRDWLGERLKHPQLPLYSVSINKIKKTPVAGIAYAKVKGQGEYQELSEAGIFRSNHYAQNNEESWLESSPAWPQVFEQLGRDFLAGNAKVNPIDEDCCRYCELRSLCRINQLSQAKLSSAEDSRDA